MKPRNKTIRVFLSSTFEDLKMERDALQLKAFYNLREHCREKEDKFQAMDLALKTSKFFITLRWLDSDHIMVKPITRSASSSAKAVTPTANHNKSCKRVNVCFYTLSLLGNY